MTAFCSSGEMICAGRRGDGIATDTAGADVWQKVYRYNEDGTAAETFQVTVDLDSVSDIRSWLTGAVNPFVSTTVVPT